MAWAISKNWTKLWVLKSGVTTHTLQPLAKASLWLEEGEAREWLAEAVWGAGYNVVEVVTDISTGVVQIKIEMPDRHAAVLHTRRKAREKIRD